MPPGRKQFYLEYVGGASSKFYAVSLEEEDGGTWRVRFNFGRIGFPRAWDTRIEEATWAKASTTYMALIDEKLGKGYGVGVGGSLGGRLPETVAVLATRRMNATIVARPTVEARALRRLRIVYLRTTTNWPCAGSYVGDDEAVLWLRKDGRCEDTLSRAGLVL